MRVWLDIAAIWLVAAVLLALVIGPMIAYGNKTSDNEHPVRHEGKRRKRRMRCPRLRRP
jgi:hypothetical protein